MTLHVATRRALIGTPTQANGLLNSLIAYWPLNEAGGANDALDLHTNGLALTQVSSPGADTGKVYATARTFDGSADYFYRNSSDILKFSTQSFHVGAWIYCNAFSTTKYVITKGNADNVGWQLKKAADGLLYFSVKTQSVSCSSFGIPPNNQWLFVLCWRDAIANTINIQINDGAIDSAVGIDNQDLNYQLQLGARNFGSTWSGRIGPVIIGSNVVLTAAQRTALYNGGAGLAYAGFTA